MGGHFPKSMYFKSWISVRYFRFRFGKPNRNFGFGSFGIYPFRSSTGLPDASLTCTTQVRSMVKFLSTRIFHIIIITLREEKLGRTISNSKVFESKWNMVMVWREIFLKKNIDLDFSQLWRCIYIYRYIYSLWIVYFCNKKMIKTTFLIRTDVLQSFSEWRINIAEYSHIDRIHSAMKWNKTIIWGSCLPQCC